MNDSKLRLLVGDAVKLDRQIQQLEKELAAHKAALVAEADSRSDEATATEGGGTSITFEGLDGSIARITTAGPTLKSALKYDGTATQKIRAASKGYFARLFEQVLTFRPVPNFREQAEDTLGKTDAAKLVKLCTNSGKTTVSFETKEVA